MTDIWRASQQTQKFPGSRAPTVVEDLDAEGNGDSLMPTDRWGKNQDIHFLLFLLFIMFGLLFVIAKAHVMYRSRQQGSLEEPAAEAQAEQPTRSRRRKRSQETIEKMIVLKVCMDIRGETGLESLLFRSPAFQELTFFVTYLP